MISERIVSNVWKIGSVNLRTKSSTVAMNLGIKQEKKSHGCRT